MLRYMFQVITIRVEFTDPTRRDDDARWEFMFDDIETQHEGLDERDRDTVIGTGCEGQDVDLLGWYRACEVAAGAGDWDGEGGGFSGAEGDLFGDFERHCGCDLGMMVWIFDGE